MPKINFFEVSSFGIERVATMHYIYILKSDSTGKYYIGETDNVERRLKEHRSSKSSFGKRNKDLELVKKIEFNTRGEAGRLESFLKKQKSHKFIDSFVNGKIEIPR